MPKAALLYSLLTMGALAQVGALTDQRIVDLAKAGLKEDELIRLVQTAPAVQFNLTPSFTDWMLEAGVTETLSRPWLGGKSARLTTPRPAFHPHFPLSLRWRQPLQSHRFSPSAGIG